MFVYSLTCIVWILDIFSSTCLCTVLHVLYGYKIYLVVRLKTGTDILFELLCSLIRFTTVYSMYLIINITLVLDGQGFEHRTLHCSGAQPDWLFHGISSWLLTYVLTFNRLVVGYL